MPSMVIKIHEAYIENEKSGDFPNEKEENRIGYFPSRNNTQRLKTL